MSIGIFLHDFNIVKPDGTVSLSSTASPTQQNHLANKQYVDTAVAEGGGDWLASVASVLATPPGSPSNGDRHLVASSGASGVWVGKENQVAQYSSASSAWIFTSPSVGTHVYIEGGSTFAGNTIIYVADAGSGNPGWVILGNVSGALLKSNNLSELSGTAATARSNLGLGSLAVENSIDLASDVGSTILPVANGGTGSASAPMIGVITAADAAAAKTVLGIGSIASQSASNVTITGGSITGITDIAIADGGTGASDASTARTNLGVAIGSDVQAFNQSLADIAGITQADGAFIVSDGTNFVAEAGATARTSLGLGTAAVLNAGEAAANLVQLDAALDNNEVLGRRSDVAVNLTSNTNFNYLYAGGTFEVKDGSDVKAAGSIVSIDSSNSRIFVGSFTTGSASSIASGYSFESSGYSFTVASSAVSYVNRNRGLDAGDLREIIGNAGFGQFATAGVAKFNGDQFESDGNNLVNIKTGTSPSGNNIAKFVQAVSAGDLVKIVSTNAYSGSLISTSPVDTSAKTIKVDTDVTGAAAGQILSISGYQWTIASTPTAGSGHWVITVEESANLNYLYGGSAFSIVGGDGFASAGAYGTAANEAVATALNDTNGKLLKVASSANLTANQLLKINSSGLIEGTTEAGTGTVTSIALADDDGDATSAITTSGTIAVVGDGTVITTNVNSSNQLEIAIADASASQKGAVQLASSSNYFGGTFVAGLNIGTGADLGQGHVFTLNSSAQWERKDLDHFDVGGPVVESCDGIGTSAPSMPSSASDLKSVYALDLSGLSADASITLPKITAAAERGIKTTIKIVAIASGKKLTVNCPSVAGGGKMLIDGAAAIELTQAGQALGVHYSDFMLDSSSSDETKLIMI